MSFTLDSLKDYLVEDINEYDYHMLIRTPPLEFIKGNDATQKEQNIFNLLLTFIDTMTVLDFKDYNQNLDKYNFCENYTLNEFVVVASCLFNATSKAKEDNESKEKLDNLLDWLMSKLLFLLGGRVSEEEIENLPISQVCGAFYYAPKVYQNDFLLQTFLILITYILNEKE